MRIPAFNDCVLASFPRSNFCGMSLPESTHFFWCKARSSCIHGSYSFHQHGCAAFIFNVR